MLLPGSWGRKGWLWGEGWEQTLHPGWLSNSPTAPSGPAQSPVSLPRGQRWVTAERKVVSRQRPKAWDPPWLLHWGPDGGSQSEAELGSSTTDDN